MCIQHSLPLLYLADPFVASQVLVHIGRSRRIVNLVPIRLAVVLIRGLLLPLLFGPAPASLALVVVVARAPEVGIVFVSGPVGEGCAGRWWCGLLSWRWSVATCCRRWRSCWCCVGGIVALFGRGIGGGWIAVGGRRDGFGEACWFGGLLLIYLRTTDWLKS